MARKTSAPGRRWLRFPFACSGSWLPPLHIVSSESAINLRCPAGHTRRAVHTNIHAVRIRHRACNHVFEVCAGNLQRDGDFVRARSRADREGRPCHSSPPCAQRWLNVSSHAPVDARPEIFRTGEQCMCCVSERRGSFRRSRQEPVATASTIARVPPLPHVLSVARVIET